MKERQESQLELDDKERRILSLLQTDAKLSLSEIGDRVGLTRMSVFNKVKSLKEKGVIEGFYCKINAQKVNLSYLMVIQVSCDVSGPDQEKVARKISVLHGVEIVYLNFGPWDVLVIARRSDKESAKDLLYEISMISGVRNTLTMIPHTVVKESLDLDLSLAKPDKP